MCFLFLAFDAISFSLKWCSSKGYKETTIFHLPSLFIPICRHFLRRHAWHWFRWALSTMHRPVPAWHLFMFVFIFITKKEKKNWRKKSIITLGIDDKINRKGNSSRNRKNTHEKNKIQFWIEISVYKWIKASLQSNPKSANIKFAFWLEKLSEQFGLLDGFGRQNSNATWIHSVYSLFFMVFFFRPFCRQKCWIWFHSDKG